MLRAVLAVALAVALVAASLPVIDRARRDHADARIQSQLERLSSVARELATNNDPVPVGAAGARRTVRLHVPGRGWHTTGVAYLAVGGAPGEDTPETAGGDVLAWRLPGGPRRVRRIEGVDLRTVVDGRVASDRRPLLVRGSGRRTVQLALVRHRGRPVVLVRRFKPGDGTTSGRARTIRPRGRRRPLSV